VNAVPLIKELMLNNINRAKADSTAVVIGGDFKSDIGMGGWDDYEGRAGILGGGSTVALFPEQ
jgi:hypothetical protein